MSDLQEVIEAVAAGYLYAAVQLHDCGRKKFDPADAAREIGRLVVQELAAAEERGGW